MNKIVLINAPISLAFPNKVVGDENLSEPLGLMYIAAVLEKNGYGVRIIDVGAEKLTLENVLDIIKREKPLAIGISALTSSIRSAVQSALSIKNKIDRNLPIILGGTHISADPDIINRYDCFDAGIVGEGEYEFLNLVNKIKEGKDIQGVFRGEVIKNLNKLPLPARHLVNKENYIKRGIITSRGCPYNCIFCGVPALSKITRFRSPEKVADEIEYIYQNCNGHILFADDTLTLRKDHILGICQEILKRKLKVRWVASTRVDRLDEEIMEAMKLAGCDELALGIESGNERIRNEVVGKGITDEQIVNAVRACKKYKIKAAFYLMLGFPRETKNEMYDTINCGKKFEADLIGIHPTLPLPGSRLYQIAIKEGKLPENIIDEYIKSDSEIAFRDFWPVYLPDNITKEEVFKIRNMGYRRFYFRPKFIFKKIKEDIISFQKLKTDIKTAMDIIRYGRTKTSMS